MIIRSHHQPLKYVLPKTCLQIVFAAKWLVLHSSAVSPPTSSDDLCLLFCIYPSSMEQWHNRGFLHTYVHSQLIRTYFSK